MNMVNIPKNVGFILNKLSSSGYGAHIVGGCVRDMLIGKTPYDFDITTSAFPEEVKAVFSNYHVIDTGIKHGTVTLMYEGESYEITTYRTEGAYTDNRHPDSVSFTRNLELDLSRRDFTMNAICADKDGIITDMFSGTDDIKAGVIRAVGVAAERFSEDALRILRAIRFSSKLGFGLDGETARAVHEKRHLLSAVSGERIYSELTKLLAGDYAYRVLEEYSDVICEVLPTLTDFNLPDEARFNASAPRERFVSLFAMGAKNAEKALSEALDRLHTDGKIKKLGSFALRNLDADLSDISAVLRLLHSGGEECAEFAASVKWLVRGEKCTPSVRDAINSGIPYKLSDMAAHGADFVDAGFSGQMIGKAMEQTLLAIIDGKIDNSYDSIVSYVETIKPTKSN